MKQFVLTILIGFSCLHIQAQDPPQPLHPDKDTLQYEGYTIRLIPGEAGGIGYDIFREQMLLVHQSLNPFTMGPRGLNTKGDAFKTAKWQVMQLKKENIDAPSGIALRKQDNRGVSGSGPVRFESGTQSNRKIPKIVAHELNIPIQPNSAPVN